MLYDYAVPKSRATWFIKMTNVYNVVIAEAKTKKRAVLDPSIGMNNYDWYCVLSVVALTLDTGALFSFTSMTSVQNCQYGTSVNF